MMLYHLPLCFLPSDGGIQREARSAQRQPRQRDTAAAPPQHPPQPPTRKLPDIGKQHQVGYVTVTVADVVLRVSLQMWRPWPLGEECEAGWSALDCTEMKLFQIHRPHHFSSPLSCYFQGMPKSHKYFSLPAGQSLDSNFFPPKRLSYEGKISLSIQQRLLWFVFRLIQGWSSFVPHCPTGK